MVTDPMMDPVELFGQWYERARGAGLVLPQAMTLATAGRFGKPAARVVLLSSFDHRGFVFHTNYESVKGEEIAAEPYVALVFWWEPPGYQVRIEGRAEKTTPAESDAYFRERPRGHRLSAWASDQSRVIPDRAVLEARMAEAVGRFGGAEVPRPPYWGGYRVVPELMEFWENRPDRLHDRLRYRRAGDRWVTERLAP
ncbi:MAG TPA: pyridoxamine 5'-phosphate oxidase [Chromatiales bacterium]|nr:pyridoxamine 5'-phosphate oxidase [Chromatiales bacterium]